VWTLLATDLVSEGLDLQDADAVVHYDVPWTPLRLEQRVGRIARLGSPHRRAEVFWFAPARTLERRLQLERRILEKAARQLDLGVAETSRVGRARLVNQQLEERERFGHRAGVSWHRPQCAVVCGPAAAVCVVAWSINGVPVPQVVGLDGTGIVFDYAVLDRLLRRLVAAPTSNAPPPKALVKKLGAQIRARLAAAQCGATDPASRRLARRIVQLAYGAGRNRNEQTVRLLDRALDHVRYGLPVGGERELEAAFAHVRWTRELARWLRQRGTKRCAKPQFMLRAAIFGDGSRSESS
jgi:hypothetical protein